MNSATIDLLIAPYRLRAMRDFDLDALPQIFPECMANGASIADRHEWIRTVEQRDRDRGYPLHLVMEETETGKPIAGFTFETHNEAVTLLRYAFRPTTATAQIAGFVLARKMAFDQMNVAVLRTEMVEGMDPLQHVHDKIGYRRAMRLREWWRAGDDGLLDFITYEAINPKWKGME